MDWYQAAQNDWEVYHDTNRIKQYVIKGKITAEQYTEITGKPYE